MKNNKGIEVFQSRWGFHSVPYAIYRKMKILYSAYWKAAHLRGNHERWSAKMTHNRKGKEPLFLAIHKEVLNTNIVEEFRNIRVPKQTPDDVAKCHLSEAVIDVLLARLATIDKLDMAG